MTECLELDGSQGEGGGQILRTALTLSMITGTPFRLQKIRAGRQKPGLLRQHLTAVMAAAEICGAVIEGATPGSQELTFKPGAIRGGDYRFAIGTAGSCTLVLQTVLPALWFADTPARISVSGGTHNAMAPPADFLIRAWLPLVARMGAQCEIELLRHGFYPAGGGEVAATTTPVTKLQPLYLDERGTLVSIKAEALVAGVPVSVAQRELERLSGQVANIDTFARELPAKEGPGNALVVTVEHENLTEVFTGFGEKGVSSERVADVAGQQVRQYLQRNCTVGEYLADQLLLPMALAGGGSFTVQRVSGHLTTNLGVIEKFLDVEAGVDRSSPGSEMSRVLIKA